MIKTVLLFILTIVMSLNLGAASLVYSHEEFVHLTRSQQDQFITKLMELAVEIESKYQHDLKKYGHNQKRFEEYKETMEKLSSILFIPKAFADENSEAVNDWKNLFNSYAKLQKEQNICLFGGWISQAYKNSQGKTVCAHPSGQLKFSPGYPKSTNEECRPGNKEKVLCNPLIFGYKKQNDRSIFCVDAKDGAHNSSYQCMQAALNPDDPEVEERLNFLRARLQETGMYEAARGFVYKTCLCNAPDNRNAAYHSYMRPHQTCYGMMEMMRATSFDHCGDSPTIFAKESQTIFENLKKYMDEKVQDKNNLASVEKEYRNFVQNHLTSSYAQEYQRICEDTSYECKRAACTKGEDGALSCTYEIDQIGPGGSRTRVSITDVKAHPEAGHEGPFGVTGKVNNQTMTLSCPVESDTKPSGYVCKSAVCSSPTECKFEITDANGEVVDSKELFLVEGQDLPKKGESASLNVTGSINDQDVSLTCNIEGKDEEKVSFTLEKMISGAAAFKLTVVPDPADISGWTIKWRVKKPEGMKEEVPENWQQTKKEGMDGLASGSDDEESVETPPENVKEITQPRLKTDYEVCADLVKGDKNIGEQCKTIDKLETAVLTPPQGNRNMGGPTQQPMRGSSDTSAVGIR